MNLWLCILFIGSSLHGASAKKHDGPPLYIRDIYTNGKPDAGRDQLLANIQKAFPMLTLFEIEACINYCKSYPTETDIIQECQDLMLWKVAHKENIDLKKKSCFPEYKAAIK